MKIRRDMRGKETARDEVTESVGERQFLERGGEEGKMHGG
jgi:hypothetical protein